MPLASERLLWDVPDGSEAQIDRVSDSAGETLRYLGELGIKPGARLHVLSRGPVNGPLMIRLPDGAGETAISRELAEAVWVA